MAALALVSAAALALPALPAQATGPNVVVRWNQTLLTAVRTGTLGPPQVARALAIVHTCAYDAWAAYDAVAVGTRLGGSLRRPAAERTDANKAAAISFAAHLAAVDLYPAQRATFDALMTDLGYDRPTRRASRRGPASPPARRCSTTGTPTAPTSSAATPTPPATRPSTPPWWWQTR